MDDLRATVERALGNQYEVLHLIGRGGMGAVYLARERFLERLVAVKVLPHDAANAGDGRARFLREAQTAARLSHPSIVPLHTFTEAEGTLLYVMGYVEGESLEARLQREGRLTPAQASTILSEIASALDYAHGMGVIHRDVKPDNILIERRTGRAFLTDFGIAKQNTRHSLTRTGMVVGTPHYMSPEQASGDADIDGRSDLYALGVIGYRMLSGRLPFDAPSYQELLIQHVSKEPASLPVDETNQQVVAAVMQCLKKNPAERWGSGSGLVDALRPRDDAELNVPDELRDVPSSATFMLAFCYAVAAVSLVISALTKDRWMLEVAAIIPFISIIPLTIAQLIIGRKQGVSWRRMLRMMFWAPPRWKGWWPSGLRRPGDLWSRLPATLRTVRALMTGSMAVGALVIPLIPITMIWFSEGRVAAAETLANVLVAGGALNFALLFAGIALTRPWSKQFGVSNSMAKRMLWEPTWNNPFWKRPEFAALLEPRSQPVQTIEPSNPADLVRAIERDAMALPESFRSAGDEAKHGARELLQVIDGIDREVGELSRDADPAERAQLVRKLESFDSNATAGSAPRSQMKALVEQQIALHDQLDVRRKRLLDDRERCLGLLRTLRMQLVSSRAELASGALSASELSGRIRAVCRDLEAGRQANREVEALLTTMSTPPGHLAVRDQ